MTRKRSCFYLLFAYLLNFFDRSVSFTDCTIEISSMLSSIACVHPRAQVAFRFESGVSALERVTFCAGSLRVGLLSLMLVLFTTDVFLGCHRLRYGQGSKLL